MKKKTNYRLKKKIRKSCRKKGTAIETHTLKENYSLIKNETQ